VPETVVLLHGFGGTRRTWDGVAALLDAERYRPLALDLPGHGEAAAERPLTFERCVSSVLAAAPERFVLCGYSMGGRIALHVALAAPGRVARLLLVACHAGIEDDAQRAARRRSDAQLAAQLESAPVEQFIARWRAQPLFAEDPPQVTRLAADEQRRNRPEALAGGRDRRYQAIARRMARALPRGRWVVVAGGHRLALENPAAVARALQGIDA